MNIAKVRAQIRNRQDIQSCAAGPFSREFLRGRKWIHVRTHDSMDYQWVNNTQSLVELITNFLLTIDECKAVYPSLYDMGNTNSLDTERC